MAFAPLVLVPIRSATSLRMGIFIALSTALFLGIITFLIGMAARRHLRKLRDLSDESAYKAVACCRSDTSCGDFCLAAFLFFIGRVTVCLPYPPPSAYLPIINRPPRCSTGQGTSIDSNAAPIAPEPVIPHQTKPSRLRQQAQSRERPLQPSQTAVSTSFPPSTPTSRSPLREAAMIRHRTLPSNPHRTQPCAGPREMAPGPRR
jgi:hypothetical protein